MSIRDDLMALLIETVDFRDDDPEPAVDAILARYVLIEKPRSWSCLEDVPSDVLRVTDSTGSRIGRTTDGRWARLGTKRIVPLDASGTFTEFRR